MNDWIRQNKTVVGVNAVGILCVATGWLSYFLFGQRLIEAIYSGPLIQFLHKAMLMEGSQILPLEEYFRGARDLMWSGTLAVLVLSSAITVALKVSPRITLAVLTPFFVLFSLAISGIAFIYPLEIETRESTVWLHVLAMQHGLNIYDHSQLAFINQNHGPFDPLFKYFVAMLFPFLEPWHVARFSVFLLPFAFFVVAFRVMERVGQRSFLDSLYLAAIGYLFLVISAKEFLFVGRSDATAALLLLPLTYLSFAKIGDKRSWMAGLYGCAWGTLGMFVVLTNWRMLPVVGALLLFSMWMFRHQYHTTFRHMAAFAASAVLAALAILALVLYHFFDFDLAVYYKHFFGVYTATSGHGHATYGHASPLWFLGSLLRPTASPESLKGGPVFLTLVVYLLVSGKDSFQNRAWLWLGVFVFTVCTVSYYLNYYGGGQWYYIPFLIVLWFYLCANYPTIPRSRFAALGLTSAVLLVVNFQTVVAPSLSRVSTLPAAYDFMDTLRRVQHHNTMLSEDTFFYRTAYGGELIDMGDMISKIRTAGNYYGPNFNRTVDTHFTRLHKDPPDYIVTGFTESPELRQLIQASYVQVATGPGNLTANGHRATRLFQRKDSLASESKPSLLH